MFHKKLRDALEDDFSRQIDEQNASQLGNYRSSYNKKPKKLILISEDELNESMNKKFEPNLQNSQHNSGKNIAKNSDENYYQNRSNVEQNYQKSTPTSASQNSVSQNYNSRLTNLQNLQNNQTNSRFENENIQNKSSFEPIFEPNYESNYQNNSESYPQNQQNETFYNSNSNSNQNQSNFQANDFGQSQFKNTNNFGKSKKTNFQKRERKNSLGKSLGISIVVILLLICIGFGGFWWRQRELENSKTIHKNCLEIIEQNKILELNLSCQNLDESWQSLWQNMNLYQNLGENEQKVETEKKNLQTKINEFDVKISKNLETLQRLNIAIPAQTGNFNNSNPNNSNSNIIPNNSNSSSFSSNFNSNSNSSANSVSSSSLNPVLSSTFINSTKPLTQNPDSNSVSNSISSSISNSNSQISSSQNSSQSSGLSINSSINSSSNSLSNSNSSSNFSSNSSIEADKSSSANSIPKTGQNLKEELTQKTEYSQTLENLLKSNLNQKISNLDKILTENMDLEKELNFGNLRSFLTNLKVETGINNNTNIEPIVPIDINWEAKINELSVKTQEINAKIEIENDKNPDKKRQRLIKLYKNFSGEQFKNLYNTVNYEKVGEKTKETVIFGDKETDDYIAKVAEKRGYQKRAQADETKLEKLDEMKLQTEAKKALIEMQTEAKKEGLEMVLVSGYRSIAEQKSIFLQRLGNLATSQSIKNGQSDAVLDKLLQTTSIPGYSRHHTGYTLDLGCNSTELVTFKDTKCYQWLSKDNYLNSKRFGLIPSYPSGGGVQGPDPEEWEYVWVGENLVKN